VPIILCDLEGRTCEEAARILGRPVGTIKCWRSRGRERLRQRLARRGFVPSIGVAASLASDVAKENTFRTPIEGLASAAVPG
jgi:hypothetical protein